MIKYRESSTQPLTGLVLAVSVALSGCGGGSSSSSPPVVGTAVQGIITGFGSVFVNGIEYETDAATLSWMM